MPYSTRRVSLNLQSLGVQLPQSRGSHRSPPNPSPTTAGTPEHPPAAKRVKRSHTLDASRPNSTTLASRPRPRKSVSSIAEKPAALTPPPSPGSSTLGRKVDTQDIKDDIVVAVIRQLEATGNKPHQIKDLSHILTGVLDVVASSQNPVAIISSRLTTYLKRPWTALAPCPLAKEQVTIHPRRVYYFLTSTPRQEIPEYSSSPSSTRHIISPSISSSEANSEALDFPLDHDAYDRALSPDSDFAFPNSNNTLSAHGISEIHFADDDFDTTMAEIDEEPSPPQNSMHPNHPPLEHDEREFSQTAGAMRQRKESEQAESRRASRPSSSSPDEGEDTTTTFSGSIAFPQIHEEPESMDEDERPGSYAHQHDQDQQDHDAALLFGHAHLQHQHYPDFQSSPMIRPHQLAGAAAVLGAGSTPKRAFAHPAVTSQQQQQQEAVFAWNDLKSPENVELAELDDLLGGL